MRRRRLQQPVVAVKATKANESANYLMMWLLASLPLLALSFISVQLIISSIE